MNKERKTKDPRKKYKSDKFKKQDQNTPALQSEMTPVPVTSEDSYKASGRLKGRNALVTGGDSGIGRAAAIAFAKEGANVAITYLKGEEKDAKEVLEAIKKEGVEGIIIPVDLKKKGSGAKIVEKTVKSFGKLDLMLLNAAQQIACEKLEDLDIDTVTDTFRINIISMYESVQAAEKYLKAGSCILTTTSVQSFNPSPHLSDYAATKAAITNFTKNMAQYFAKKGVRVNGVAPGPIWTPLQLDGGQPPENIPGFGQDSLMERAGQPIELAPVYVFLASNEASYVTGQIYGVTGGEAIN